MRRLLLASAGLLACAVLSACPDRDVTEVNPIQDNVDKKLIPVTLNRDLDLLFVIDNSGSMAGEQASLAANFPTFISVLQQIEGGLPNIHIGIVSSNVGAAGQASVPGCAGQGDDGNLLVKAGCTGLTGQFISDVADATGNRVKNYTGDLGQLFSCMAQLGTGGCGFEMHLESMYRALQPGKNPGFYRAGAYLGVIVIADEDDCSTEMGAMFGDPTAGLNSPLGPRTSFRCFEFGIECDNDPNPRAFGTKSGCKPRENSQYMYEIDKYIDFLKGLKEDPTLVIAASIVGVTDEDTREAIVGPDPMTPQNPELEKSCFVVDPNDPNDGAVPSFRLVGWARAFANRNSVTSICAANLSDALNNIANLLKLAIGNPCLTKQLADRDPSTTCDRATGNGCEYECSVADVRNPNSDNREENIIEACDKNGNTPPCWKISVDAMQCTNDPGQLKIEVNRGGGSPPSGTYLEVQCVTE
ncbi:MAG TPA: vWA domain-containing protein [Kofleriaceae bacterium]|nr:vWA domain-containing protein [Kofleriaceae bacterium]